MTGKEVYEKSIAFLMEKPYEDSTFADSATHLINAGLHDLVAVENSIRASRGEESVSDLEICSLEDEIPASREVAKLLPLYLASHFFSDDLNEKNAEIFYNRFKEGKSRLMRAYFVEIEDGYGGGADVW